jgi:hypothetical protein
MAEERTALAELDAREAELACECEAVNESDEWSAADAERIDLEEQDIALRRAGRSRPGCGGGRTRPRRGRASSSRSDEKAKPRSSAA